MQSSFIDAQFRPLGKRLSKTPDFETALMLYWKVLHIPSKTVWLRGISRLQRMTSDQASSVYGDMCALIEDFKKKPNSHAVGGFAQITRTKDGFYKAIVHVPFVRYGITNFFDDVSPDGNQLGCALVGWIKGQQSIYDQDMCHGDFMGPMDFNYRITKDCQGIITNLERARGPTPEQAKEWHASGESFQDYFADVIHDELRVTIGFMLEMLELYASRCSKIATTASNLPPGVGKLYTLLQDHINDEQLTCAGLLKILGQYGGKIVSKL